MHCVNICHICIIAQDYSAVPKLLDCTTEKCGLCTPSLLVIGVNLSYNLKYSAKIPIKQVIRSEARH